MRRARKTLGFLLSAALATVVVTDVANAEDEAVRREIEDLLLSEGCLQHSEFDAEGPVLVPARIESTETDDFDDARDIYRELLRDICDIQPLFVEDATFDDHEGDRKLRLTATLRLSATLAGFRYGQVREADLEDARSRTTARYSLRSVQFLASFIVHVTRDRRHR